MAGTREGGLKAAAKMKERYGEAFYANIGKEGGAAPKTKPSGFAYWKATGQDEKIAAAGKKGGRISRRPA